MGPSQSPVTLYIDFYLHSFTQFDSLFDSLLTSGTALSFLSVIVIMVRWQSIDNLHMVSFYSLHFDQIQLRSNRSLRSRSIATTTTTTIDLTDR